MDDSNEVIAKNEARTRHLLFGSSVIATFLYGGAYYGWGPMQLMLEAAGAFQSKCEGNNNGETCEERTQALLNVRLISQVTLLSSPVLGEISGRYGAQVVAHLQGIFCIAGIGLLVASLSTGVDWLLHPSFWFLAMGAWASGMLVVETGLVFRGKARARVISTLSSTYDSSSVTYLCLWGLTEISDMSELAVMILYLAMAVITFAAFSYFWYTVIPDDIEGETEKEEEAVAGEGNNKQIKKLSIIGENDDAEELTCSEGRQEMDDGIEAKNEEPTPVTTAEDTAQPRDSTCDPNFEKRMHMLAIKADLKISSHQLQGVSDQSVRKANKIKIDKLPTQQDEVMDQKFVSTRVGDGYVIIAIRSPKDQLLSEPFVMLASFFTIQLTASVWALTTARDFLSYLGDDDYGNRYLSIFTLLGPASMVALPFVDRALNDFGFHFSLQVVNVLALGYTGVKVVSDNLNVQIVGFVLFSFYRGFLFSSTLTCLPSIVSRDMVGRSIGVFNILTGLFGFVNVPLANFAVNRLDGNFFIPNLVFFALNVPCIFLVWRVGRGLERERVTKESQSLDTHRESRMEALERAQPARLSTFVADTVVTRRRSQALPNPKRKERTTLRGVPGERGLVDTQDAGSKVNLGRASV